MLYSDISQQAWPTLLSSRAWSFRPAGKSGLLRDKIEDKNINAEFLKNKC